MLCLTSCEILDNEVLRLNKILRKLPNLRDLRYFRRVNGDKKATFPTNLIPSILSTLRAGCFQLGLLAIDKFNGEEIDVLSAREIYLLGKMIQHVQAFNSYSEFCSLTIKEEQVCLPGFKSFLSSVELEQRKRSVIFYAPQIWGYLKRISLGAYLKDRKEFSQLGVMNYRFWDDQSKRIKNLVALEVGLKQKE